MLTSLQHGRPALSGLCEVLTLNSAPVTHVVERRLTGRLATLRYVDAVLTASRKHFHILKQTF